MLQGQADIPLNETGHKQTLAAGVELSEDKFDLVISSDLSRALQTAQNIVKENKTSQDIGQIQTDCILRERSFGVFEDRPIQECSDIAKAAGKSFYEVSGRL